MRRSMGRIIRSEVEGNHDRLRERKHQRKYAKRHGYYWLQCVLCAEWHGGHEAGGSVDGSIICGRCTAERQEAAERHLRELGRAFTIQTSRWGFPGVVTHRVGDHPSGHLSDAFEIRMGG